MRIAIASGKGGTGKTTVAVNLAVAITRQGDTVHLCDCDVEEPNADLFLNPFFTNQWPVTVPVPTVNQDLCSSCGKCADICEFNAIACLPHLTMIYPDLCHSCGGCWLVCPSKAITPEDQPIGKISTGISDNLTFTQGRLQIGQTLVPPLIEAVKDVPRGETWIIFDAPPGTTCPVMATLQGVDFVLLVAEPTPFGRHDLALALELTRRLKIPCGVVINRSEGTDGLLENFCNREGVEILARIPFRREVAAACAEGGLALDTDPEVLAAISGLITNLRAREVWA